MIDKDTIIRMARAAGLGDLIADEVIHDAELVAFFQAAYRQGLENAAKRRAAKPRTLPPCGTGALLGEQQYCFEKGWREGAASVRAAIRELMKEPYHG